MFDKFKKTAQTEPTEVSIQRLRTALREADAVVLGAGAGLSTAAGYTYAGERFERYFRDFIEKYQVDVHRAFHVFLYNTRKFDGIVFAVVPSGYQGIFKRDPAPRFFKVSVARRKKFRNAPFPVHGHQFTSGRVVRSMQ